MTIEELFDILLTTKPSDFIKANEESIFLLIPELKTCKEFEKTNFGKKYSIYKSMLKVIDNIPKDLTLRISALFSNIGKPSTFTVDEQGIGHFYQQWLVSSDIFKGFANKYQLDNNIKETVMKLITFQNIDIEQLTEKELIFITNIFSREELIKLYTLKKVRLLTSQDQNNSLLQKCEEQENKVLKRYGRE